MIKKSLITAGLLLLGYGIVVLYSDPDLNTVQNQQQYNVVQAQRFLFEAGREHDTVIVGSSLSCRLLMERFPADYYNLSLGGLSVYDGLNILSRAEAGTRNVLIEMNVVDRPENSEFREALFSPLSYNLQRVFPVFRPRNQPVGLLSGYIKKMFARATGMQAGFRNENTPGSGTAFFRKVLQQQVTAFSHVPAETLDRRFEQLQRYVNSIEQKGMKVIFYEMPMDEQLCASPLADAIRNGFYRHFPPARYRYIPKVDCRQFATTDGLHLAPEAARTYSDYLSRAAATMTGTGFSPRSVKSAS